MAPDKVISSTLNNKTINYMYKKASRAIDDSWFKFDEGNNDP